MYKNKKIKLISLALTLIILFSNFTFAYGLKDGHYYNKTDYYKSTWQWLDLNADNVYECYYFNVLGHMMKNTTTLDGYVGNSTGL